MGTTRFTARSLRAAVAAIGLALALGACGSSADTSPSTTSPAGTSPATTTTTGPAESPPPTSTPLKSKPTKEPPTETTAATTLATRPTPPTRDDATVDARDFQSGPAFYFQSPSGNILCGVYPGDPQLGAGCQAVDAPASPDGPPCQNTATSSVGIKLAGGAAQRICLNQGLYVGPPVDGSDRGGGRVLAYGDTIIVQTVACQSAETGITCWEAGSGFTLSRERNEIF